MYKYKEEKNPMIINLKELLGTPLNALSCKSCTTTRIYHISLYVSISVSRVAGVFPTCMLCYHLCCYTHVTGQGIQLFFYINVISIHTYLELEDELFYTPNFDVHFCQLLSPIQGGFFDLLIAFSGDCVIRVN